ncbi:glycosyltransferase family 28 protein [Teladorsagia circumcincta]|uniref:UDP-glucuronosyltransferase n=1 Tax=Teladorsagia circumcincta TaxID=45464 RepID=A0A2G9UPQ3_TELCI|nr:glycosyltransferase family 28 protein [Teladorsagia circumcincta]
MANTNNLYEIPRPTLAKVVNIGGLGMESRDVKPLPKKIEEIMEKGDGAVVLSFGSVAVAYRMPMEWKMVFLESFKRFPNYQFLVRYESDDIKGNLSSNVHLFKWFPQTDILNHPKTKALITHGGYNSFQEAILTGVPLITIPLFGDQPKNARLAEHHGFGIVLHKAELTVTALSAAIQEVLTNSKFKKRAERLSQMTKRQPVSPAQLVVKWSEFAAEFQTLENLEPAGNKLNFFQYHSLDVIAFLISVLLTVLVLTVVLARLLWKAFFIVISRSSKRKSE